jgi:ABC-type antimicrobial peptide transport system permease subunit
MAILGEVGLVGLAGGLAAAGLAQPIARLIDVRLSSAHAALAVPVALTLALAAATVPALRAARTRPAVGLRPAVASVRRAVRRRTIAGLAMANLGRSRGRTALGAGALAVGVAALTLLAAITFAFHGAVVGTALGDAVSLRVRGVDTLAVAATMVLAAATIADVLYLNVRERAAEIATLHATGWSPGALARLVTYEGLGIGALGAGLGATAGLAATGWFVGTLPPLLVAVAVAAAVAGTLLAGLAALVPALMLRFIPLTTRLAED